MKNKNKVPKINTVQGAEAALSYSVLFAKDKVTSLLKRHGVNVPSNASDKDIHTAVLVANQKSPVFRDELAAFLAGNIEGAHKKLGFVSFAADNSDFGFTGLDDFQFTGDLSQIKNSFYGLQTQGEFSADGFKYAAGDASDINSPTYDPYKDPNSSVYVQDTSSTDTSVTPAASTNTKSSGGILAWLGSNVFTKENIQQGINVGLKTIANKTQQSSNNLQQQANNLTNQQAQLQKTAAQNGVYTPQVGTSNTTKYVLIGVGVVALIGVVYLIVKNTKK
jgi:hypothetical protein